MALSGYLGPFASPSLYQAGGEIERLPGWNQLGVEAGELHPAGDTLTLSCWEPGKR